METLRKLAEEMYDRAEQEGDEYDRGFALGVIAAIDAQKMSRQDSVDAV